MEQHRDPGGKELRHDPEGPRRITRHLARNVVSLGPELCMDTHLQGWVAVSKPRSVHRKPMPLLEVEEHFEFAARSDDPGRGRSLPDLAAPQEPGSLRAFDSIFPVENVGGPTIGISNGTRTRERFDLSGTFLTSVVVVGNAHDGSAGRFEFDASACARAVVWIFAGWLIRYSCPPLPTDSYCGLGRPASAGRGPTTACYLARRRCAGCATHPAPGTRRVRGSYTASERARRSELA